MQCPGSLDIELLPKIEIGRGSLASDVGGVEDIGSTHRTAVARVIQRFAVRVQAADSFSGASIRLRLLQALRSWFP